MQKAKVQNKQGQAQLVKSTFSLANAFVPLRSPAGHEVQTSDFCILHSAFCIFRAPRRAFTLIEVMLAMAILAIICGTIYQFTATMARAADVSIRVDANEQAFSGLRRLLNAQLSAIPPREAGGLVGVSAKGKHGQRDALQMVCGAGNAILTPDARGYYQLTLGLREVPRDGGHYSLTLEREPYTPDQEEETDPLSVGNPGTGKSSKLPSDWVLLMNGVSALEIAYFDPRLNNWVEKWNDDSMLPSLVRVRLTMENAGTSYEFIEAIPGGGIRRNLPELAVPNYPVPNVPANQPTINGAPPPPPPNLSIPPPPPNMTVPPPPPSQAGPPPPRVTR